MDGAAIFYDASGRRRKRFSIALLLFVLLNILAFVALFATIRVVPAQTPLPIALEHGSPRRAPHSLLSKTGRSINRAISQLLSSTTPAQPTAHRRAAVAPVAVRPLSIGFYVPWDQSSTASLQRHVNDLDWIAPVWLTVVGPTHQFKVLDDRNGRAVIDSAAHIPAVLPVIQNFENGQVDPKGIATLLADPRLRTRLLDRMEAFLAANRASGAVFDFEDLDRVGQFHYLELLREAQRRFAPHKWLVTVAVPVASGWDMPAFARVADKLFLMAYDEHTGEGAPGPIASEQWWASSLAPAIRAIPPGKAIVTLGNYAYDWHDGTADPLNVEEAWLEAADSQAMPMYDRASGNSSFAFSDERGQPHIVWLLDAASAFNQLSLLDRAGLNQVALWRLGAEDPALWSIFGRGIAAPRRAQSLTRLPAGTNVDIEGSGEILRVSALPTEGKRRIDLRADGTIGNVQFAALPRPYTITRTGYRPRDIALTFDDGPDKRWTPQILDVLKAKHVPATFFIVGENGLTQRGLLTRMLAEGHEVGSHTYTHPNLATAGTTQTLFELNATQRLFEAFTGQTLKLFRAPYFGDAEPTTADEILPALEAQDRGYLSVGLHVDSEDWQRPGVARIVANTVEGVLAANPDRSGNIVLLHDSGGDRSQTVAALPILIDQLRARGYRFVPVSALAGLTRAQAMPELSPADRVAAQTDLALFTLLGFGVSALGVLFTLALTLGIARAVFLTGLALISARREARRLVPTIDPASFVTVIIPAFNEERVIERSVHHVLASRDVRLEVIVVDDGSTDDMSGVVERAFGTDERVRLVRIPNGGKARALNHGLALAAGDIVVALDADTQFEATTIARLVRWFAADPRLGAVAGNAKVGNRVNIVTKWQALEYITAQNLERRALAQLGAMTVVPGAVGAWRRRAIEEVGGFPPDTLAEDQDLTIAVQRAGWHVTYDQSAIAWTEAPRSLRQLARQRFRWAFGTIQCMWKHKRLMADLRPRGLALVGLPQTVAFQLFFALVSPIIDLALIVSIISTANSFHEHGYTATEGDLGRMAFFWLLFAAIDLTAGLIAFALERRERWGLVWWMIPQRFVYRQVMYYVVIKAMIQALRGPRVGWTSIVRAGDVSMAVRGA